MDENVVSEESNGMGEGGVVMVQGGTDDPLIEDRISEHIDKEDFPLGNKRQKRWRGILLVGC